MKNGSQSSKPPTQLPAGTSTNVGRGQPKSPTSTTSWRSPVSWQRQQMEKDPDLVIAALLHDAIEDQEVPRGMIAEIWGEEVVKIVEEVTDDNSPPKGRPQAQTGEECDEKVRPAKLIKLADKTSNLRAIIASPSKHWSVKRRLEYVEWAQQVVDGLRGTNEWLKAEFDRAAKAAEESVRAGSARTPFDGWARRSSCRCSDEAMRLSSASRDRAGSCKLIRTIAENSVALKVGQLV